MERAVQVLVVGFVAVLAASAALRAAWKSLIGESDDCEAEVRKPKAVALLELMC